MKTIKLVALCSVLALMLALTSCGSGGDETADQSSAQPQEQTATTADAQPPTEDQAVAETLVAKTPEQEAPPPAKKPAKKPEPKKEEPKAKEPPPAPEPVMVNIASGTQLVVALNTKIRTDSNHVGDAFTATLVEPVTVDGKTVLEAGTALSGTLTKVEEPHRTKGKAQLTLVFDELTLKDGSRAIVTQPIELVAEGDKISDEEKVAAGGVIGGVIGAIAGKKKGKSAAVGAAIGAAAGGAIAVATKGQQLELTPGQQFTVQVAEPVEVPVAPAPKE